MRHLPVVDDIRVRILVGEWRPGQKIPSLDALAHGYRVDRSAVYRAIMMLVQEGYLIIGPDRQRYVDPLIGRHGQAIQDR